MVQKEQSSRRFGPLKKKKKKKKKKKDASIRDTQSQNYKTKLQTLSFSEGVFYAYCVQVAGLLRNMNKEINILKGVLHPRLVFGLFLHFSQKLQHIGNK